MFLAFYSGDTVEYHRILVTSASLLSETQIGDLQDMEQECCESQNFYKEAHALSPDMQGLASRFY
jgi:hypothetical protein